MKRLLSMTTRQELTEALRARYRSATFGERIKILDEFVALTGHAAQVETMVSELFEELATKATQATQAVLVWLTWTAGLWTAPSPSLAVSAAVLPCAGLYAVHALLAGA